MSKVAVFTNPSPKSSVTSNLQAKKAKGGIRCDLLSVPTGPKSRAVFKNGKWEEVSCSEHKTNEGSSFQIELDDTDEATTRLISALKKKDKPTIDEIVVWDLKTTDNKEQYGHFFSKVFVTKIQCGIDNNNKFVQLDCKCMSFKQRDSLNNEPVLWDWDTNSDRYTGETR